MSNTLLLAAHTGRADLTVPQTWDDLFEGDDPSLDLMLVDSFDPSNPEWKELKRGDIDEIVEFLRDPAHHPNPPDSESFDDWELNLREWAEELLEEEDLNDDEEEEAEKETPPDPPKIDTSLWRIRKRKVKLNEDIGSKKLFSSVEVPFRIMMAVPAALFGVGFIIAAIMAVTVETVIDPTTGLTHHIAVPPDMMEARLTVAFKLLLASLFFLSLTVGGPWLVKKGFQVLTDPFVLLLFYLRKLFKLPNSTGNERRTWQITFGLLMGVWVLMALLGSPTLTGFIAHTIVSAIVAILVHLTAPWIARARARHPNKGLFPALWDDLFGS